MKRLTIAFLPLLALVALLAAGCGGGGGGGSVAKGNVAVVGSDTITKSQLDALLAQAKCSYKLQKRVFPKIGSPEYQTLQGQAMQFFVDRAEYAQKATQVGVNVTDKQVDDRLTQIKKQYFGGSEKRYQAQLKQQCLTDPQVREDVRGQLVSESIFKKVTAKVSVSDADALAYYKAHPEQYSQPESRDVRHILVKDKPTADKIYKQLKGGGDFAALAKRYSQDPGSKTNGGKLTILKGQTVPQFDQVAFSLKTNELSQPVHTQYGWHVIQALSPIKPSKTTPFKQVKDAIKQQLLQQRKSEAIKTWSDGVKKEFANRVHYAAGFTPPATATAATTTTG